MLKIKHVPEQLIDATLTPVLFTVMFTYMFGGAIAGSTGEYLQFILPGILVMSVLFTTVYSGVALNTDLTRGVVDRFRSLPIARPAPLVGAVLGDSVRYLVAATVVVIVGIVLGYWPEGGLGGLLAAMLLVVVFAFGLAWVFTTIGLLLRSPNAVMNGGFMALFPLTFLSNVFVEPETLPSALEAFVDVNPISILVTASRGLSEGNADAGDILIVLRRRGAAHRDLRAADDAPVPQAHLDAGGARGLGVRRVLERVVERRQRGRLEPERGRGEPVRERRCSSAAAGRACRCRSRCRAARRGRPRCRRAPLLPLPSRTRPSGAVPAPR